MERIKKNFGFGFMRLPMIGDEVDIPQTTQMVDAFLKAGFRYGDAAPMAIIELVDRDVNAKKAPVAPVAEEKVEEVAEEAAK